tara:strand:+ start:73 stop:216 length:144 start_codon:yes stop_codon:yes gene_type:complete
MNKEKCSKCKENAIVLENTVEFCVSCYRRFVFDIRYKQKEPNIRNPR